MPTLRPGWEQVPQSLGGRHCLALGPRACSAAGQPSVGMRVHRQPWGQRWPESPPGTAALPPRPWGSGQCTTSPSPTELEQRSPGESSFPLPGEHFYGRAGTCRARWGEKAVTAPHWRRRPTRPRPAAGLLLWQGPSLDPNRANRPPSVQPLLGPPRSVPRRPLPAPAPRPPPPQCQHAARTHLCRSSGGATARRGPATAGR